MTGNTVNVLIISCTREIVGKLAGKFWMCLQCAGWVCGRFIVHFLAVYLQCTGSEHWVLPPVSWRWVVLPVVRSMP